MVDLIGRLKQIIAESRKDVKEIIEPDSEGVVFGLRNIESHDHDV